jgi:hypothetical protein
VTIWSPVKPLKRGQSAPAVSIWRPLVRRTIERESLLAETATHKET